MNISEQNNIITVNLEQIDLSQCSQSIVTISDCCNINTCNITREDRCRYSIIIPPQVNTVANLDSINDIMIHENLLCDDDGNCYTFNIDFNNWNNDNYSVMVNLMLSNLPSGYSVELHTDDNGNAIIDILTPWRDINCHNDYNAVVQYNSLDSSGQFMQTTIDDTNQVESMIVSDCNNITIVDNNTFQFEVQNEGIYTFSVTCNTSNNQITETACIALIDSLKCDVQKKLSEGTRTGIVAHSIYNALLLLDGCKCVCDKACEMYEYLLSLLGKLKTGCYE